VKLFTQKRSKSLIPISDIPKTSTSSDKSPTDETSPVDTPSISEDRTSTVDFEYSEEELSNPPPPYTSSMEDDCAGKSREIPKNKTLKFRSNTESGAIGGIVNGKSPKVSKKTMKTTKSLPEFSKNSVRESPVEDRVSELHQNQSPQSSEAPPRKEEEDSKSTSSLKMKKKNLLSKFKNFTSKNKRKES